MITPFAHVPWNFQSPLADCPLNVIVPLFVSISPVSVTFWPMSMKVIVPVIPITPGSARGDSDWVDVPPPAGTSSFTSATPAPPTRTPV